ncbi:MAG: hypothetical protein KDC85_18060 [Saprospiraceae bacterium]|nr:hypothetical protein [Saprospiraceae bacterium]MCB9326478.1 hypothetical protein [Lewinellaceae bacterium]
MMKNKLFILPFVAILTFLLAACSNSDNKNEAEAQSEDDKGINISVNDDEGKTNININADNLQDALKQLNNGKEVAVVDHRELKDLFPNSIGGFKRVSAESQKTGFGGLKTSIATAEYKDGDAKLKLSIVDAAGIGLAINAMAGWTGLDIDKETDDGYERTTEIDGHKAFVSYDNKDEDGQIAMFIRNRVLYTAEITNGSEKQLKKGQQAVDPDDIIKLIKKTEK